MSRIVLLYNPRLVDAEAFGRTLIAGLAGPGLEIELASVWDEAVARQLAASSDFIVTLGGDGTLLRAARIAVPLGVPIVGVNLGKLGFLTELNRQEAARKLPQFVEGQCWTEERVVLSAEVHRKAKPASGEWVAPGAPRVERYLAINEIVLGRAALARAVDVHVWIDGVPLAHYVADGAMVATPTGSTAYSLAAGGPILPPQLENLLLIPVLPHLNGSYPLVCPSGANIQIEVYTGHQASITVDGQVETPLYNGDIVRATIAPERARFLRIQPASYFYRALSRKLKPEARKDEHRAGPATYRRQCSGAGNEGAPVTAGKRTDRRGSADDRRE